MTRRKKSPSTNAITIVGLLFRTRVKERGGIATPPEVSPSHIADIVPGNIQRPHGYPTPRPDNLPVPDQTRVNCLER
ncbi:hypothetical protein [Sphaerimonospora mesophila]|uniref:hypothetical protein n=1 Tax=Sphaerimonospora mesophila TaxID=37483 RepID=UPI00128ECDEC